MTTHQAIAQYIHHRQAAGADFRATARLLEAFGRAVGPERALEAVSDQCVRTFLDGSRPLTAYWHRKHSALRGFYRFARSHGLVARVPLPTTLPTRPPSVTPYIFTRDELRRLLDAAARSRTSELEPSTMRALLLLLYGAALRLSEALRLTVADVDLNTALLTIRDTKFYKTRLVPIGPDLCRVLEQYAVQRRDHPVESRADATFLTGRSGRPVRAGTVRRAFARLRQSAGIRRTDGARYQPRLHDLRHAFVGHRMTAWYRSGAPVQQWLAPLSTYLGHGSIAATQVYLTMTPELLHEASRRFAHYAEPEVEHAR